MLHDSRKSIFVNHASSSTTFLVLDKLKISKERIGFVNFVVLNTITILIYLNVISLLCCKGIFWCAAETNY